MSKNIIFIINIVKDERSKNQGYDYSIKSWENYSNKLGADLFILDEPLGDLSYMKPQWYKMYILDTINYSAEMLKKHYSFEVVKKQIKELV